MSIILGLKLSNRLENSLEFQRILSQFGCAIRTRIGLHQIDEKYCATSGIILLEVVDTKSASELSKELLTIDEIEVQQMIFN